jgi:hypothetical protein
MKFFDVSNRYARRTVKRACSSRLARSPCTRVPESGRRQPSMMRARLLSNLSMRAFAPGDVAGALAWLGSPVRPGGRILLALSTCYRAASGNRGEAAHGLNNGTKSRALTRACARHSPTPKVRETKTP